MLVKRIAVIPPLASLGIPRRILVVEVDEHAKRYVFDESSTSTSCRYDLDLCMMGVGFDAVPVFVDDFDAHMQTAEDRAAVRAAADELELQLYKERRRASLGVGAWLTGVRL